MGKVVALNAEWQQQEIQAPQEIKIRFKELIKPLEEEEYELLEESIQEHGCRDRLVLWNGILLDGHHRYEICTRHNIPFSTVEYDFPNRHQAKIWMFGNQKGRRNLNDFWKARYGLLIKEEYEKEAKECQKRKPLEEKSVPHNCGEQIKRRENETNRKIAADTGLSHNTIHKVGVILDRADPEQVKELEDGELSINRAYLNIKALKKDINPKYIGFPQEETYGLRKNESCQG